MSFLTKIIYEPNNHSELPVTVTESGQPSSVEIENLSDNTQYDVKAQLWNGNVMEDESSSETFTTLAAGTISLTHVSTVKSGNSYVVSYTVSSTYALSSAILSCNGANFQGVISGNGVVFTVTGLSTGAYLYTVTATDIYTETGTANGTIIAGGYSAEYFTVTNLSDGSNTVSVSRENSYGIGTDTLYVSTDGGAHWTEKSLSPGSTVTLAVLALGESLVLKHTGAMRYNSMNATDDFEISGNIASLCFGDNFTGQKTMPDYAYDQLFWTNNLVSAENLYLGSYTSVSNHGFYMTFHFCPNLETAPDFSSITSVGDYGMYQTFHTCEGMAEAPDLSSVTSVGDYGMYETFVQCTFPYAPDLSSLTSVGNRGMLQMFYLCEYMEDAPDLSSVTSVGNYGMNGMFRACSSLETPPDLSSLTSVGTCSLESMFQVCTSLETPPDLSSVASVGDYGMHGMFNLCRSLTTAPDLSSVASVGSYGLAEMFYNCTSLTAGANLLSVTSLGTKGLRYMYGGCSSLASAWAPKVSWSASDAETWLYGVAGSGTLYADPSVINTIPENSTSGCPSGWTKQAYGGVLPSPVITASNGVVTITGTIPAGSDATLRWKDSAQGAYRDYTEPIGLADYSPPLTVYAQTQTAKTGWASSAETTETLTKTALANPVISYDSGTGYATITGSWDSYASASVHYTTDGATPTSASATYSAPFAVSAGDTVKAIAIPSNAVWYNASSVTTEEIPAQRIQYVDYIHTYAMGDFGQGIFTQVHPTETMEIRAKGMGKGFNHEMVYAYDTSQSGWDANDWRFILFSTRDSIYDIMSLRADISYQYADGSNVDLTMSNNSVYNNATSTAIYTGNRVTFSQQLLGSYVAVNVCGWWVQSVQMRDNGVTVFDGHAAYDSVLDKYGIYDSVSQTLYTNNDLTIVGETIQPVYDCTDCINHWADCGYSSYEDCDCQENGNCPGGVTYHDWVHLSNMLTTSTNTGYIVGTGIAWDDPDIYFRVTGMTKGYTTGGIIVGHFGVNDSASGMTNGNYSIRIFNTNPGYYDFNFPGSRMNNFGFNGTDGTEWDLTCGNNYVYDNKNSRYMTQGATQSIGNPNAEIFFDMSSWWISTLEIFDSNGNRLFNGRAAELGGRCGLYDSVSDTLKYHATYTAVCEDAE